MYRWRFNELEFGNNVAIRRWKKEEACERREQEKAGPPASQVVMPWRAGWLGCGSRMACRESEGGRERQGGGNT